MKLCVCLLAIILLVLVSSRQSKHLMKRFLCGSKCDEGILNYGHPDHANGVMVDSYGVDLLRGKICYVQLKKYCDIFYTICFYSFPSDCLKAWPDIQNSLCCLCPLLRQRDHLPLGLRPRRTPRGRGDVAAGVQDGVRHQVPDGGHGTLRPRHHRSSLPGQVPVDNHLIII